MYKSKNSLIKLNTHKDNRGGLVAIESGKDLPFDIARVYYIFENKGNEARGFHAHKNLQQLMICVAGHCDIQLDDGNERLTYHLNSPEVGVLITKPTWREMHNFSKNCVLVVIASDVYKAADYIHDYDEFKKVYGS